MGKIMLNQSELTSSPPCSSAKCCGLEATDQKSQSTVLEGLRLPRGTVCRVKALDLYVDGLGS